MTIICFFNHKGGVGTTSLVYHLAWQLSELGYGVVAADLDPQASLSTMFLDEEELVALLEAGDAARTIYRAVQPLAREGDIEALVPTTFGDRLALIPGDIGLSAFEGCLSESWIECLGQERRPFAVVTALYRVLRDVAATTRADVVLVDVGPALGAINRAALLAADHVVVPVGADPFALHGLRHLGPGLAAWREGWSRRLEHFAETHAGDTLELPRGAMQPAGYVATQPSRPRPAPGQTYRNWLERVPDVYLRHVLGELTADVPALEEDGNCLARLKHYPSLMLMGLQARKPIFDLTPADGAIGAHVYAARDSAREFRALAEAIVRRCQIQRSEES